MLIWADAVRTKKGGEAGAGESKRAGRGSPADGKNERAGEGEGADRKQQQRCTTGRRGRRRRTDGQADEGEFLTARKKKWRT